ncbi:MAG: TonB-dependent receptor [Gemmatimonadota bacterium]|nr:TonB-dependent receptor [Gemmatimonadota bacterium]MDH5759340.1 TonB-dependent receptor [Gemmatimonadota bacterium]
MSRTSSRRDPMVRRCVGKPAPAILSVAFLGVIALVLPGKAAALQSAPQGALHGRVVDAESRDGVDGAEVSVLGTSLAAVTDRRGRFAFPAVPAGSWVVSVARLGYGIRTDTVRVPDGVSVSATLTISTEPIPLEGLVVDMRSLLLEKRGFYDRKRQGFSGLFMDRTTIEDRNPLFVSDLFRSVPGVEIVNDSRLIMNQSVNLSGGGRGCEPAVWLDGIRSTLRNYDFLKPDHIEGIEVYTGNAPGKYNDLCGTVVIWTRVPVRRR